MGKVAFHVRRSARLDKELDTKTGSVIVPVKAGVTQVKVEKGSPGRNRTRAFMSEDDPVHSVSVKDKFGREVNHKVLGLVVEASNEDLTGFFDFAKANGHDVKMKLDEVKVLMRHYAQDIPLPAPVNGCLPTHAVGQAQGPVSPQKSPSWICLTFLSLFKFD